ncbi:MAG TPA: hypothetical protein ENJ09_01110 [Planctomycetes bacterium]|nr:hypothetical protein [Planctomycetota bacterium]
MTSPTARRTPSWLLALGREDPPAEIEVEGRTYRLGHVFKHDFFAFTGRYDGDEGSVVLKMGRKASFLFFPLSWIGRLHSWHESAVFRAVEDLDVVPRFTGRFGKHGLTHEYIEGHQLERGESVPPDFFDRLERGLEEIHRRGMAYVDLEKPENVLVGEDGSPWLFDFQISFRWPWRFGQNFFLTRWFRARFQESDHYHLRKLRRRCSPETMSPDELQASRRRPGHIRFYNGVTRPLTRLRRRILNRIDPVKKRGERGRIQHGSRRP